MSYRDYDLRAFRMDGTVDYGEPDWPDDSVDYRAEWEAEHVLYGTCRECLRSRDVHHPNCPSADEFDSDEEDV